MEAAVLFETFMTIYQTVRFRILEDNNNNMYCHVTPIAQRHYLFYCTVMTSKRGVCVCVTRADGSSWRLSAVMAFVCACC